MGIQDDPDVRIEREGGAVRQVLHLARPFTSRTARTPAELATLYLHQHAELFELDRASLPAVEGMPPVPWWVGLAKWLRAMPLVGRLLWPWLAQGIQLVPRPGITTVRAGESLAVVFQQRQRVHFGWPAFVDIPVWEGGIRLMVALSPLRLTAAYSTLRRDLPLAVDSPRVPTNARDAAKALDIPADKILGIFVDGGSGLAAARHSRRRPASVLVYGRMHDPGPGTITHGRRLPYREHLDLASRTVVRRHVLASHVDGRVFHVDPRSKTGGLEPGPERPEPQLDPHRTFHELRDLTPPEPGQLQGLHGTRVCVAPDNPLGILPPTRPVGTDFDYHARRDDFAAVNAYHHCDSAFRMVQALGFPLHDHFWANVLAGKFPVRVVHRAPIPPGRAIFDGRTVNAQVVGDDNPWVVGEIRFAYGDMSDPVAAPLGLAADARFAWHEFGHVLLIAATGDPEFKFAHSAGDALAAIICDLDSGLGASVAEWRFVTFPWVEALRRHDQDVRKGWGWHGSLYDRASYGDLRDPDGYRAEQILSSTLFRLYRALGGDAETQEGTPDLVLRRSAAAYTVYLLVAAIKALGPGELLEEADGRPRVPSPPAEDAYALAGALMCADVGTQVLEPDAELFPPFAVSARRGGAVHKVVRWAFQQQGLYAPGGGSRIWDAPGSPEPVDVFVEDGRHGEYGYTTDWHTSAPHVRVAAPGDPGGTDSPPNSGTPSHVFVRVQHRGAAQGPVTATVTVFAALAAGGPPPWQLPPGGPGHWVELGPAQSASVEPGGHADVGPFPWSPQAGRHGLLACVEAPGDPCNALAPTLACAVGPTPLAQLVPFDNNLAYREVDVVP